MGKDSYDDFRRKFGLGVYGERAYGIAEGLLGHLFRHGAPAAVVSPETLWMAPDGEVTFCRSPERTSSRGEDDLAWGRLDGMPREEAVRSVRRSAGRILLAAARSLAAGQLRWGEAKKSLLKTPAKLRACEGADIALKSGGREVATLRECVCLAEILSSGKPQRSLEATYGAAMVRGLMGSPADPITTAVVAALEAEIDEAFAQCRDAMNEASEAIRGDEDSLKRDYRERCHELVHKVSEGIAKLKGGAMGREAFDSLRDMAFAAQCDLGEEYRRQAAAFSSKRERAWRRLIAQRDAKVSEIRRRIAEARAASK